jgi:hypothetical protein
MKLSSRHSRGSFPISEALDYRLKVYVGAASAAGLSMLALTQPTKAEIVFTPANVSIVRNGGLVLIDLNHDGIPDFGLNNKYFQSTSRAYGTLAAVPARPTNEIAAVTSRGLLAAAALPGGVQIGANGHFQRDPTTGLVMALASFDTYFGPWLKVGQAFLGLKFTIKGQPHFGWARVTLVIDRVSITAALTGYAYETIPNQPITAGQTSGAQALSERHTANQSALIAPTMESATLGRLAQGASGLVAWRKRDDFS